MKIQLIDPPCDWVGINWGCLTPSISLLSIMTYIRQKDPSVQVSMLDGGILAEEKIKAAIEEDADIYGLRVNAYNYESSIRLTDFIKSINPKAKVVFGGQHATALPNLILKNRPNVDAVIKFDGERAIYQLSQGYNMDRVNNLVYRKNGSVTANRIVYEDMNEIPYPDHSLIDLSPYFENSRKLGKERRGLISSHKGCLWREKKGGCLFCAQPDMGLRVRRADIVWEEYIYHGVDSTLDDWKWFEEFHALRRDYNIKFDGYAEAFQINPKSVKMLKELNFQAIFMGIESNDAEMLKSINKASKPFQNEQAVRLLRENGIMPRVGLVLGLPGETEESLQKTLDFSRKHLEGTQITCSILNPLPPSPAYYHLLSIPEMHEKYGKWDYLKDNGQIIRDWVKNFCKVDYERIMEVRNEILSLAQGTRSFFGPEMMD